MADSVLEPDPLGMPGVDLRPSAGKCRQFGLGLALVTALLALRRAEWLAVAAALLAVAGLRPTWLAGPFAALSLLLWPLGRLASELLLAAIYFGVFWPVGLLRKALGWRGLGRIDRSAESYFTERRPRPDADYLRQS